MPAAREIVKLRCGRATAWSAVLVLVLGVACGGRLGGALALWLPLAGAGCVARAAMWAAACTREPVEPKTRFSRAIDALRLHRVLGFALHIIEGAVAARLWMPLFGEADGRFTQTCTIGEGSCLIEKNLYLLSAGAFNGAFYYISECILKHPSVSFPLIDQRKFIRMKFSIYPILRRAASESLVPPVFFAVLYYWKGSSIRNIALYLFSLKSEAPLDGLFSALTFPLLLYVWIHAVLYSTVTRTTETLFDTHLTEKLEFPIDKTDLESNLAQELSGKLNILNQLASRDLLHLSKEDAERRMRIFSLSLPGGHPTNWNELSKVCLGIVDSYSKEIDEIVDGGRADVQKSPTRSPPATEIHIRPGLRSLASPVSPMKPPPTKFEKTFREVISDEINTLVKNLCEKPIISFFFGELTEVKVKKAARQGTVVSKVSQGLARLSAASLREDSYGVVQNDLGLVIASLIRLKLSLDKFSRAGVANRKNSRRDAETNRAFAEVKSAIKRSLYEITTTFGEHMREIPLDSDIRAALQPFLNLHEG